MANFDRFAQLAQPLVTIRRLVEPLKRHTKASLSLPSATCNRDLSGANPDDYHPDQHEPAGH
jgi:hypothetical protein